MAAASAMRATMISLLLVAASSLRFVELHVSRRESAVAFAALLASRSGTAGANCVSGVCTEGPPARLGMGEVDAVARNAMSGDGLALYQEDTSQVSPKMKSIAKQWAALVVDVRIALSKATPAYRVAADKITNEMNVLKVDMRLVSRILVGGDGTKERTTIVGMESFDYNTGRFKLQPLPDKAEALFSQVNDLYFLVDPRRRADPASGLASIEKADRLFGEWFELAQQSGVP